MSTLENDGNSVHESVDADRETPQDSPGPDLSATQRIQEIFDPRLWQAGTCGGSHKGRGRIPYSAR